MSSILIAGGGNYFDQEIKETAEIQPLQEHHITMMQEGKNKNIDRIRVHCMALGEGSR